LTCLTGPGTVKTEVVSTTTPPQEFIIYLPPCYQEMSEKRYPVIYLLNGQTFTDDQWVRMGVPEVADEMIHAGEAPPFIVVFPDDRYWNSDAGATFGDRLIFSLIPYVDMNYRTLADRNHRALGGLSRGGGWTTRLGFTHADLFGTMGLHSPYVFVDDQPVVEYMIKSIPPESRPRLWLDVGDADKELRAIIQLEEVLTKTEYIHEYHRFVGDHTENYWGAHVKDYLRWYTEPWQEEALAQ
jgi:enterochelin esterase-like enzyme